MSLRRTIKDVELLVLNPRFVGPCMAGLFCLVVATVVGVIYLFSIATILLALPIASYIIARILAKGLSAERDYRMITAQGERISVIVRLCGIRGPLPEEIIVHDVIPDLIKADEPYE